MKTLVELKIDGYPPRTELVSEKVLATFKKLGWFENGKAKLIER